MLDKIWFTYRARIRAQERLASNDLHSQALLVWYAVVGACLAIVAIRHPQFLGPDTDIISAIFGVAVLALSMLVTNRDYRGRSLEMRKNYLALQELYNSASQSGSGNQPQVQKQYQELLNSAENHAEIDDKYFRVFHIGALKTRVPTLREKIEVHLHLGIRAIILCLMYVGPLSALFFI
ncbi:SLATT domain-containing protein [Noviherbaspirillum sp.]|uniref:SLATT domain-containing protein n=1 Tax=Noviherbaspirillum sp. TaxID=1926288 RepID=UPI002FE09155